MMIQTKNKLNTIVHPLVASMYLKHEFGGKYSNAREDALVIETNFPVDDQESKKFDSYLADLLADLPEIQTQVEARVGPFDRVYIRSFH